MGIDKKKEIPVLSNKRSLKKALPPRLTKQREIIPQMGIYHGPQQLLGLILYPKLS